MITRKIHFVPSKARPWILTPDTSPQLSPIASDCDADDEANMSSEDLVASRPISIGSSLREDALSPLRPSLEDILNERSQFPYTLSAFTAYLSQQHCLETLEFTVDAKQYQEKYRKTAARLAGMTGNHDHPEVHDLLRDWIRLLDVYIQPGSPREINLPAEERDDLLDQTYQNMPPAPETLEAAVKRMHDLMSESIFMPFLNSFNPKPHAKTFSVPDTDFGGRSRRGRPELSMSLLEDRGDLLNRKPSRRRRSPPSSSSVEFSAPKSPPSATYHRHAQSSGITSAISLIPGSRLSTHVSHSSAASAQEGGFSDDSGSADSPGAGDLMTPPTTPPSSDLPLGSLHGQQSPKPNRSDSGSWRKMGKKLWGKKRSGGTLRERLEEE